MLWVDLGEWEGGLAVRIYIIGVHVHIYVYVY